jgi:hypothetical protein
VDLFIALAFVSFVVGAVFGFVRKDYPIAFVAVGLALVALTDVGIKGLN